MKPAFYVATVTGFVILCAFLPFFPGRYDSIAVSLSLMAQLFAKIGLLLLVPAGALWLLSQRWGRLSGRQHVFAIVAALAFSLVWMAVSLGAFLESVSLAVITLAVGAYIVIRIARDAAMTSSTIPPEQLALDRSRGHYAVHDTPYPHWKYFWFD